MDILLPISDAVLAKRLNISQQAVGKWRRVPAERVIDVAEATNWKVTPHQLRPDIYPNPGDALPPDRMEDALPESQPAGAA